MRAAASLYLPVLLIIIFAGENGEFKLRPVEHAQTAAPSVVLAKLASPTESFTASCSDGAQGMRTDHVTSWGTGTLTGHALLTSEQANDIHVHNSAFFARNDKASCRVTQSSRRHELSHEGTYTLDDLGAPNDALYYELTSGKQMQLSIHRNPARE